MRLVNVNATTEDECDECGCKLRLGILIGENSGDFKEDTRQALLCVDCLEKALEILYGHM